MSGLKKFKRGRYKERLKNEGYLSKKINSVFLYIAQLTWDLDKIKSGIPLLNIGYSASVELPRTGSNRFMEDLMKLTE